MTALVTGATSGIGRAIAVALAVDGAPVWAVGRRTEALHALTADWPCVRSEQADLVLDDDPTRPRARVALGLCVRVVEEGLDGVQPRRRLGRKDLVGIGPNRLRIRGAFHVRHMFLTRPCAHRCRTVRTSYERVIVERRLAE